MPFETLTVKWNILVLPFLGADSVAQQWTNGLCIDIGTPHT